MCSSDLTALRGSVFFYLNVWILVKNQGVQMMRVVNYIHKIKLLSPQTVNLGFPIFNLSELRIHNYYFKLHVLSI